ncbi:hypothetical protein [Ketobacter sp.]|uniref:hypothetical protein n=1 Tax=Ketobacter sp. TaxID=2083498 RepID=UPI000F2CE782|nr:hypothetical protein [Ketobacter sp.]RLU01136.1 MAG: hypothetical protein D9N14_04095 [Ketobacter sp.]
MNTEAPYAAQVTGLLRRMELSYGLGLFVVLLIVTLTHLPMPFNSLSTDDYLIRANIEGEAVLFQKGFPLADPDKSLARGLADAFHFYSPEAGTLAAYTEYGNLPWWSAEAPKMNPWRPLAALTHWLDFQIAPASYPFQLLHSLIYLLLFGFSAYRLFWRLSPRASVAVLATLFVVVDYSHFINFSWIAARNVFITGALGCFVLERFIAWRQQGQPLSAAMALMAFVLALLSAESGIAVTGYLFAYLWLVEKTGLRRMAAVLWPYAVVVILWRVVYSAAGYGTSGISLYVDPMRSPMEFLAALLTTPPALFAGIMTSIDGYVPSLSPQWSLVAVVLSACLVMLGVWLILPLLRSNALARFMFLGSVLASIPASSLISGSSRSGVFIAIGFFWILSIWLHQLMDRQRGRGVRLFAKGLLGVHLVLPVTIAFVASSMLLPVTYSSDMQYESVAKRLHPVSGQRSLVVVNSRAPNREFYLPFTWHYEYGVVPQAINALAPGMSSFYLTRKSQREYELRAPVGLALAGNAKMTDLNGEQPALSEVYYLQMLQGLFTESNQPYRPGDVHRAGDLTVTVLAAVDDRPTRIRIRFDAEVDPDDMAWQWYNWETRQYQAMSKLAFGETRFFPGPLDADKRDLVDICWNCSEEGEADGAAP